MYLTVLKSLTFEWNNRITLFRRYIYNLHLHLVLAKGKLIK